MNAEATLLIPEKEILGLWEGETEDNCWGGAPGASPPESSCSVGIFGTGGGDAALGIPKGFRLPVWWETTGFR